MINDMMKKMDNLDGNKDGLSEYEFNEFKQEYVNNMDEMMKMMNVMTIMVFILFGFSFISVVAIGCLCMKLSSQKRYKPVYNFDTDDIESESEKHQLRK